MEMLNIDENDLSVLIANKKPQVSAAFGNDALNGFSNSCEFFSSIFSRGF